MSNFQKIEIIKNDYSRNHNSDFNKKIEIVADEIFQTQLEFPAGYKPVGNYNEEKAKKFSSYKEAPFFITKSNERINSDNSWETLSEYERIIASNLLYGSYHTYILSGGMGTGKTTTATHVLNFIELKYKTNNCAFIKISFNFNLGIQDNTQELIKRFEAEFYNKLRIEILYYIKTRGIDILRKLIEYCKASNFKDYEEFYDFMEEVNDLKWLDYENEKRAQLFLKYIGGKDDKITSIQMFMKFLGFVKIDKSEDDFIIIFYDNIDTLEPIVQLEIFKKYILPLNLISQTKCLICLRRTTFFRNIDINDWTGAHSFGFIHHHGHDVSEIIADRLLYWSKSLNSENKTKNLEPHIKDALKKRMDFLFSEITIADGKSISLKEYINALSGNSLRLGLLMCTRLIENNIIDFDKNPKQRDRYKKALIVSPTNNLLLPNNSEIFNLFNSKENFSLLALKILQIIESTNSLDEKPRINELYNETILKRYCSIDEFTNTIRWMLHARRPIIYSNKIHKDECIDYEASLYITEIGFGYINTLVYDLTYIQECFMVVSWDSDIIPTKLDIQNEFERLALVVKGLRVAFDEEDKHFDELQIKNIKVTRLLLPIIEKIFQIILIINVTGLNNRQLFDLLHSHSSHIVYKKKFTSTKLEEIIKTCDKFLDNS